MAQFYYKGETKVRPGVYQRYSKEAVVEPANYDGFVAFILNCNWGEVGKVTKHNSPASVKEMYGDNASTKAVEKAFDGGATTVYCYRLAGTGGAAATIAADSKINFTAKYVGDVSLSVKVQAKVGDATTNQILVYNGDTLVETFEYPTTGANLDTVVAAVAQSKYITATKVQSATGTLATGTYTLEGGTNPTVANADYGLALTALEPYYYNVVVTDTIDSGVAGILKAYVDTAQQSGKSVMAVIGDTTSTAFATRASAAAACDNEKVVYFASGWKDSAGNDVKGVDAIAYVAGAIAGTPCTRAITRLQIKGASDVIERLTNAQYENAINNGLLLVSAGPSGEVWFDSGVNTLINPNENQDEGWKKIKRVKTRFELMTRIDNVLSPKIGSVGANTDGVAYLVQCGSGVIQDMVAEGKLEGGAFYEDIENPFSADSVWFIVEAVDIDSLEKVYLHYKFSYAQN